jgi:hypothetical protein
MRLFRRAFIGLLAAGAAGLTASALRLLGPFRSLPRPPGPPTLSGTATGAIGAETLGTLLAATRAVVLEPIEATHYAAFFRWRARHLPGHHALYERFRVTVDGIARREVGLAFSQCSPAAQRRILRPAIEIRAKQAAGGWPSGAGERDWLLYEWHIVREALALFARTDAWILLGYEAWPGTPRGLTRYLQAPRRKA